MALEAVMRVNMTTKQTINPKSAKENSIADDNLFLSLIFSENYVERALKMSSASRDWRFKD